MNAGPDLTVTLPAAAAWTAPSPTTACPTRPVATTATWSKVSGPGTVTFGNPAAVDTTATFSADGTYVLRLSATDSTLTATDDVTVTVSPARGGGVTTFEVAVASGSDDAEQRPAGGVDLTSSDLELVTDGTKVQRVGLRFNNLQIPAGATITRAWIQFQTDEVSTDVATLTLRAEATDNAPTYLGTNGNLQPRLDLGVGRVEPACVEHRRRRGPAQQTPDISALVEAVVGRPGWAPGNAVAIQVAGTGAVRPKPSTAPSPRSCTSSGSPRQRPTRHPTRAPGRRLPPNT